MGKLNNKKNPPGNREGSYKNNFFLFSASDNCGRIGGIWW